MQTVYENSPIYHLNSFWSFSILIGLQQEK